MAEPSITRPMARAAASPATALSLKSTAFSSWLGVWVRVRFRFRVRVRVRVRVS